MVIETQLVTIDNQLRLILFALECSLDVEFPPGIVEQIFSDYSCDQVSIEAKRYTLWAGPRLKVTGHVEEYEPGDMWLTVEGRSQLKPSLAAIIERAKYQAYRLERCQKSE